MHRILVLDDAKLIVDIFDRFLKRQDYEVIPASTGNAAVGIINSKTKIDLMIVDLRLPDISGIEVLKEGQKLGIPGIIISSGLDIEEFIEPLKAIAYNPNKIFYKPVNLNAILDEIKSKLGIE